MKRPEQSIYSRSSASGLYGEREEEEKKGEKQELFLTIFVQENKNKNIQAQNILSSDLMILFWNSYSKYE